MLQTHQSPGVSDPCRILYSTGCIYSSEAFLHACIMFIAAEHPLQNCQVTFQAFTSSAVLLLGHHHHVYFPDKLIAKHSIFGMSPWPVV